MPSSVKEGVELVYVDTVRDVLQEGELSMPNSWCPQYLLSMTATVFKDHAIGKLSAELPVISQVEAGAVPESSSE